jgi:hypothetical protein
MKHLFNIMGIASISLLFVWWVCGFESYIEKTQESLQVKTKHYESEEADEHRKMKVFKHQTWYGDTMLVTVDTTYFYNK